MDELLVLLEVVQNVLLTGAFNIIGIRRSPHHPIASPKTVCDHEAARIKCNTHEHGLFRSCSQSAAGAANLHMTEFCAC